MKKIKDLKKIKGFTLMEVIIAIAILGVVMLAISSLILSGIRYFFMGHEQSNAQADGRLAMDQILEDIRYSKEISLTAIPSVKVPPYSYIYIDSGSVRRFIYNYGTGDWSESTTPGTFTAPDSTYLFIKNGTDGIDIHLKSISEDLKQNYPIDATIKLPNFNINRSVFASDSQTSAQAIRFKIDNETQLLASLALSSNVSSTSGSGSSSSSSSSTSSSITLPINIKAIEGVKAPKKNEVPDLSVDSTSQYTATISWSPALQNNGTYKNNTIYIATITITPLQGYTLTGVTADFFTVAKATATNSADSGVVTAVFPKTN